LQKTFDCLRELGVKVELVIVPGGEHVLTVQVMLPGFCPGAAEAHGRGMLFLARELFDGITTLD